jgi:zinc transport system permease protein
MTIIDIWYKIVELLPFSWAHYDFMKSALLAVLLITPLFALLGTLVVVNRMVFFTDVLGHSALTGIAIGAVLGLQEPTLSMLLVAVLLAAGITALKSITKTSMDTVLGVVFSFVVALGIVLLSRQGGFVKYAHYLIGDILSVNVHDIIFLLAMSVLVLAYWYIAANSLTLTSVNESLARSRMVKTFLIELSFSVLLALVVMVSIRLVGILIINSLLVLPAAASRNLARNMHAYTFWAVGISVVSGIAGLIQSYYWGTASGATIVLFAAAFYGLSMLAGRRLRG